MRYKDRNERMLEALHPSLAYRVRQALEELEIIGEDILITDGYRTNEEQDNLYAKGRTKPGRIVTSARGGWSFHNYGLAIDVAPVGPLGIELSKRNYLEWVAYGRYNTYGRIFQGMGLQWGYQMWGIDRPHFQCTEGLSIRDARSGERPSAEDAKSEYAESLVHRLNTAKKALTKWYIGPQRRIHLEEFVEDMTERLSLL